MKGIFQTPASEARKVSSGTTYSNASKTQANLWRRWKCWWIRINPSTKCKTNSVADSFPCFKLSGWWLAWFDVVAPFEVLLRISSTCYTSSSVKRKYCRGGFATVKQPWPHFNAILYNYIIVTKQALLHIVEFKRTYFPDIDMKRDFALFNNSRVLSGLMFT